MSAPRHCSVDSEFSGPGSVISVALWSMTMPVVPTVVLICSGLSRNDSNCVGATVGPAVAVVPDGAPAVVLTPPVGPLAGSLRAKKMPVPTTTMTTTRTATARSHGVRVRRAGGVHGGGAHGIGPLGGAASWWVPAIRVAARSWSPVLNACRAARASSPAVG